MWIKRRAYVDLRASFEVERAARTTVEHLRADAVAETRRVRQEIAAFRDDGIALRERLIDAEATARAASARADFMTMRVNQLQIERDQLFRRAFVPDHIPEIQTPQVAVRPTIEPPGLDFDDPTERGESGYDVGDMPQAPIDRMDEITGLTGKTLVTSRRFDPASELGITQPED